MLVIRECIKLRFSEANILQICRHELLTHYYLIFTFRSISNTGFICQASFVSAQDVVVFNSLLLLNPLTFGGGGHKEPQLMPNALKLLLENWCLKVAGIYIDFKS